jgi:hypothetical protein
MLIRKLASRLAEMGATVAQLLGLVFHWDCYLPR